MTQFDRVREATGAVHRCSYVAAVERIESRAFLMKSSALTCWALAAMRAVIPLIRAQGGKNVCASLLFTVVGTISASASDDTAAGLNKATAVFAKLTESEHGVLSSRIASAVCIAVIPEFKKGAAGLGIGFGRGIISCRKDGGWSVTAAIALETTSLKVQLSGAEIDIVMRSTHQPHGATVGARATSSATEPSIARI